MGKKCIFLLILLIGTSIHSDCLAGEKEVIGIDDAVQLALLNNYDLKITQLSLANHEIELKKGQLTVNAGTRIQQLNVTLALIQSQELYRATRHEIMTGLIRDFIQLANVRQNIALAQAVLQIRELDLKRINELYTRGNVIRGELMRAQLETEEQNLIVRQYKEQMLGLIRSLKNKIGHPGSPEFKEIILDCTPVLLEEGVMLERAFETSSELKEMEIRQQIAEVELEKARLEGQPELERQRLLNNRDIAHYRLVKTRDQLAITAQNAYAGLTQALQVIESRKAEVVIAEDHYQHMQLGFAHGIYAEIEYLESKAALMKVQIALLASQADYYLKRLEFYYLLGQDESWGGSRK